MECRIGGSNTHDVAIFVSGFLTISFELFNTDSSFEVACFVDVMMNAEGHGLPWADGHCAGCLQHRGPCCTPTVSMMNLGNMVLGFQHHMVTCP